MKPHQIILVFIIAVGAFAWWQWGKVPRPAADALVKAVQSESYATSTAATGNAEGEKKIDKPIIKPTNTQNKMHATLHTTKGDVTIEFSSETPNTTANFVKLAKTGFYDGVKFHRVIKGFMIQGGDPLSKDDSASARWGTGGPGYMFEDEITPDNHNDIGTISMANSGPDTNGSQFFINTAPNNFLDTKHTVFGRVTAGMDVVKAIESTETGPNDRPIEPMVIKSISF